MKIKKHIPNTITCCNLLCGCLAIVQAFEGNLVWAAYLVGMGAIFDFFDGFAARMLKVSSPIGKDLDSLTDMVTFGVVPGLIVYQMVKRGLILDKEGFDLFNSLPYLVFFPFIIIIFSAIRLAKFNNDTRQSDSFIGVPTPAVAIFICSIPLITNWNSNFSFDEYNDFKFLLNPHTLCFTSLVFSFLLISEIPLFALKFKHFKWKDNEIRFVFLGLCLLMLVTLQFVGIPLIIIMYILLSMINNMLSKRKAVS
jgi:CDP-diacylglycerol---serine O-phosphatidyltransferase